MARNEQTRAWGDSSLATDDGVTDWRRDQLERAGFDPRLALLLGASRVDLHALIGLVEHGCPPHLAARIMAPLEAGDSLC